MRVAVIGLGVQGAKRVAVAGGDVVATVDPASETADYPSLDDVPADTYDAALVCTPDDVKIALLERLLGGGKHVLVEKPLIADDPAAYESLRALARKTGAVCYTAYNHRFEPHFVRMRDLIASGRLGRIYSIRMFYGNGTARLVRDSQWRDKGYGVLFDLGSHLLDTVLFWIGRPEAPFHVQTAKAHENASFDHIAFGAQGEPVINLEMMLLSWRNHFYADVHAEHGSAHIRSLCKWGPSTFTVRHRKLPSGRPDEESATLVQADPTWALEYEHFKALCADPACNGHGNLDNDIWINQVLGGLGAEASRLQAAPDT